MITYENAFQEAGIETLHPLSYPAVLERQIRTLASRLGTSEEQPGDLDQVQKLAHELRNRLTIISLRAALEKRRDRARSSLGGHLDAA